MKEVLWEMRTSNGWLSHRAAVMLAGGTLLGTLVVGAVANAEGVLHIPGTDGVIHGCIGTGDGGDADGRVRLIDPSVGGKCRRNEEAVQWNEVGPQGIPGPQGVPGSQGAPGPAGPPGPSTTYSAGDGLALSGTTFSVASDALTPAKLSAAGSTDGEALSSDGASVTWRPQPRLIGLTRLFTDYRPNSATGTDWQILLGRLVQITKRFDANTTDLRLTYQDTVMLFGSQSSSFAGCQWAFFFDGNPFQLFTESAPNTSSPSWSVHPMTLVAMVPFAGAGAHTISVEVRMPPGGGVETCGAGYPSDGTANFLSVEELPNAS